ncbi:MAG: ThiF family adenylyltransferase [Tepidisphaeraceae bacterium]
MDPNFRYHRQTLIPWIGPAGQRRLAASRVLLVGCGALGCVIADQLVRAGVGTLRIADRDIVEATNLQRQTLFDESDVTGQLPKAIAAARRLSQVNSQVAIDPHVVDIHSGNIERLADFSGHQPDVILDGTDNAETRYLINDFAVRDGIPWVYGAAVATEGRAMAILPGRACLRCLFRDVPQPGQLATCDTAGVLAPTVAIAASHQVTLALKILVARAADIVPQLLTFDLTTGRFHQLDISEAKSPECPCCARRDFVFLNTPGGEVSLCGRNAVQIRPAPTPIDMDAIAAKLSVVGTVRRRAYFLQCDLAEPPGWSLTVFPDGRIIVQGTSDRSRARSIVARYFGA